jgi:hypothetical protein
MSRQVKYGSIISERKPSLSLNSSLEFIEKQTKRSDDISTKKLVF